MGSSSSTSMHKLRADLAVRAFFTVPETAKLLGLDERTVRKACQRDPAKGGIPATRIGVRWLVPTTWLRQQAGGGKSAGNAA